MDERWQKVREVFDAAIQHPSDERRRFVETACDGDESLRSEVEALLSSLESAGEFLESSPVARLSGEPLTESADPSPGTLVGHYKIVRRIGEGGMGKVYLAQDTRLDRNVALKLLASHITRDRTKVSRFRQEALATSRLNHPNIVTIYEVGKWGDRDFIVTEFVEGTTLRDRLRKQEISTAEALSIALQIASALDAAHGSGIVHRDIKPENVIVRDDGLVKVLDFGVAKYRPGRNDPQALVETGTGEIIGTVAYMSPEQARGLDVDARTDVWSLGVILYEMLAGRAPFAGESKSDRLVAILGQDPDPLPAKRRTSQDLQKVVDRALAKDRSERYSDVAEMADALQLALGSTDEKLSSSFIIPFRRRITPLRAYYIAAICVFVLIAAALGLYVYSTGSGGGGDKRSIAVLPVKPIDPASRDVVFEVGIADSLIQRLSSTGLIVRPLSAVRKYADLDQDPLTAGKEQHADYVLASNYLVVADKIRLTVQIWNVETGQIDASYKTEKETGNVLAMQDAVAEDVGGFVMSRYQATVAKSVSFSRGTANEEAYRLYLQAMNLIDKESAGDSRRAIELLDQALALDPNFAKAWANKARAHCNYAHLGGSSPDAEFAIAKPAIERAFSLDRDLPEAHAVLGIIRTDYDWNFVEGQREFQLAIERSPGSDIFYRWYANRLAANGRFDEAIANVKTAIDLNPAYIVHQVHYGRVLYLARRYDEAVRQLEQTLEVDPNNSIALWALWQCFHVKGDYSRAFETFLKFQRSTGADAMNLKDYERSYANGGWQCVLSTHLRIAKSGVVTGSGAFGIAMISAMLGDREQAFKNLELAAENRTLMMPNLASDPAFDQIREDPRFKELLGRVVRN